jgi:hypothetical protein
VKSTKKANTSGEKQEKKKKRFEDSRHVAAHSVTEDANAFEAWVATILEKVAEEEMKYHWQHPLTFPNSVAADPVPHPLEPFPDYYDNGAYNPSHIRPTSQWKAGYFVSYSMYFLSDEPPFLCFHLTSLFPCRFHPFPYSLKFEYNDCTDCNSNINPFSGYLRQLKTLHTDIPLFLSGAYLLSLFFFFFALLFTILSCSEIGVSSSRTRARIGANGLDQGGHNETEQAEILSNLLKEVHSEGFGGAFIFSVFDEWFKKSWNTEHLEDFNRQTWRNPLNSDEFYGLLAIDSTDEVNPLYVDGDPTDWYQAGLGATVAGPFTFLQRIRISNDAGYVYICLQRKADWNLPDSSVFIAFDIVEVRTHSFRFSPSSF